MSILGSKVQKRFQTARPEFNTFEKKLIAATLLLIILNLMDIELTLWGIRLHLIEEGNPLMQVFIDKNPLYLKGFKILLPIILGAACWRVRDTSRTLIVSGMGLTLCVYLLIILLHAHWIVISVVPLE